MVQQEYDDESVTFLYMAEVSHEVVVNLPIPPLFLEGRLGMNVSRYLRSSYTIETKGYQWDNTLNKVNRTGAYNYLEEIDRHWIQHTDNFTMRNKQYKGKHRIMKDGNESLQTMGLNTHF